MLLSPVRQSYKSGRVPAGLGPNFEKRIEPNSEHILINRYLFSVSSIVSNLL